uniref:Hydrolase_4 domain-containing protein n=1 Tax=Rhabditophanes sp. KR3021 TaxID=114890 RepID=A0AC35U7Z0_9BILA
MSKGLCTEIIERSPPKMIITKKVIKKDHLCVEGEFISPVANYTPNILPKESHVCYWKGFFPLVKDARKVVIHLAGTGDHTYVRRQWGFSDLLLKSNVGSILIENPYYGKRRPQKQFRSSLMNVTDLYIMGAALMTECNCKFDKT